MATPFRSRLFRKLQNIFRDVTVRSNEQICFSHPNRLENNKVCVVSQNFVQNRSIVSQHVVTSRHYGEMSRTLDLWKTTCHTLPFDSKACVLYIPCRSKGHSKWQNIQSRKKSQDELKSLETRRMRTMIGSAIKSGGGTDPKFNSKLAQAIAAAKKANVSKAAIEGEIKRMEEKKKTCSDYQMMIQGPHGSFFLIQAYTNNMNKMNADMNKIVKKLKTLRCKTKDCSQAPNIFDYKGELIIEKPEGKDLEEIAITCDAEEFIEEKGEDGKDIVKFICDGDTMMGVKKNLEQEGYEVLEYEASYIPKAPLDLTEEELEDVNIVAEKVEEYEDLTNYYVNI